MIAITKAATCIAIALGILIACNTTNQLPIQTQTRTTVGTTTDTPRNSQPNTGQHLNDAPDFTLDKVDGEPFTLSEHKGQIVVINIWATWCAPCRKEIPDYMELQQEMKNKGVLFVGVSIDEEGWKVVRPVVEEYQINYPVVVDDGSVFEGYGPFRGIPITYVVNQEGKVEYVSEGMTTKGTLKPVLQEIANRRKTVQ